MHSSLVNAPLLSVRKIILTDFACGFSRSTCGERGCCATLGITTVIVNFPFGISNRQPYI